MYFSGIRRTIFMVLTAAACLIMTESAFAAGITVIPDESVFFQVANFLLLIFILNKILFKPIRNVLIQRKEKIQGLEERIDTFSKDLEEKEEAYAAGIKEARAKGMQAKAALMEAAGEEEKELIGKINNKAQADLAEVRAQITKNTEAVKASLLQEVDGFAEAISEKILGRSA